MSIMSPVAKMNARAWRMGFRRSYRQHVPSILRWNQQLMNCRPRDSTLHGLRSCAENLVHESRKMRQALSTAHLRVWSRQKGTSLRTHRLSLTRILSQTRSRYNRGIAVGAMTSLHLPQRHQGSTSSDTQRPVLCDVTSDITNNPQSPRPLRLAAQLADITGINVVEAMDRKEVLTVPNAITITRMVSSPAISWFILTDQWEAAIAGVALAGFSDFLDGFIAKHYDQKSILGTFLDPLADKILVGCVALPLVAQGALPAWIVATMIGRDAALIGLICWVGSSLPRAQNNNPTADYIDQLNGAINIEIEPTMVSKVNMGLQVALLGSAMTSVAWGIPGSDVITALSVSTGATCVISSVQYFRTATEIRRRTTQ
uniref:CDP-diacylglycerol--glycerol-3-phosphate 3-phosphatidyltransferase n=1 Tax=Octactis speculum TaxID=3111310 RepID=A0A7S2B564_9STRA|mmetsp:Transcript_19142/g.25964  ORF Transcript_19142/g.25964 Transcript_19142/m.25964 type:complete len:372 (+) Transcript_19142:67-1182(+)